MDQATYSREAKKYDWLWANGYRAARWKKLADHTLRRAAGIDATRPALIDLGAGNGEALRYFAQHELEVKGVDISAYAALQLREEGYDVRQASLDDLSMFPTGLFHIGFCNDVIEHVPEELVRPSLEEMARVSRDYLMISVCPTPSHHLSQEGDNLHLTVRPQEWWEEELGRLGEVTQVKFWLSRSLRYEIKLD